MEAAGEGSRSGLSSGKLVALAAGLSVGAATVGYIVYRHISNTSPHVEMEESRMSVPLDVYRNITRNQVTFLDLVKQKSGAQVRVASDPGDAGAVSLCLLGSAEQVLTARCVLDKMASDYEVITEIIDVPQTALGRIIGRGGESLKFISRTSGARVNCPRDRGRGLEDRGWSLGDRGRGLDDRGKVTITGTRREVQEAKEQILEKVMEEQTVRRQITQSSAMRQKRRTQGEGQRSQEAHEAPALKDPEGVGLVLVNESTSTSASNDVTEELSNQHTEKENSMLLSSSEVSKFEIPSPDLSFQPDEFLEVYVSASENPHHFWIQILGVRSLQLDQLTAEMSRFYGNDGLPEQRVESIVVGDIVAAPYRDHRTWNRARVLGVLPSGMVDLYYVDFGDNGEFPRDSLRSMRSDFLSLPFQAIECSLAGVCPAGEEWTEAALDEFDRLVFCAEWKPIRAKLCSYSHSESSSWPSVRLFDNRSGKDVDLGEELVRLGHAVHSEESLSRGDPDDPGLLQKMLDDVTGVTSELSLSCISLSEVASISGSVDDVLEDEMI